MRFEDVEDNPTSYTGRNIPSDVFAWEGYAMRVLYKTCHLKKYAFPHYYFILILLDLV